MTVELRHKLLSFDALSTHVDIEVTPFVDAGRVFGRSGTVPFTQLHPVGGIGFRGIARPFVVGYVDVGHGSEVAPSSPESAIRFSHNGPRRQHGKSRHKYGTSTGFLDFYGTGRLQLVGK